MTSSSTLSLDSKKVKCHNGTPMAILKACTRRVKKMTRLLKGMNRNKERKAKEGGFTVRICKIHKRVEWSFHVFDSVSIKSTNLSARNNKLQAPQIRLLGP
ncbi:hypothetical protein BVRB_012140 [Beta vulgaris subsp. vulgaris]|uniref:Uncharacterized protein n=1 Tax=Beta vulgaris subsp. vulgaris TaxID=3555 RepID=A0A0J8B5F4_BETVV|nr:hypothetical protein BVRB_012140 [Beta vulgaris subsp. vulgaris]